MRSISISEDYEMADPCMQKEVLERFENRLVAVESRISEIAAENAETKVYMKMVLSAQEEIKNVIELMRTEIRQLSSPPIQQPQKGDSASEKRWIDMMLPNVFEIVKWALLIVAGLVGIKLIGGK